MYVSILTRNHIYENRTTNRRFHSLEKGPRNANKAIRKRSVYVAINIIFWLHFEKPETDSTTNFGACPAHAGACPVARPAVRPVSRQNQSSKMASGDLAESLPFEAVVKICFWRPCRESPQKWVLETMPRVSRSRWSAKMAPGDLADSPRKNGSWRPCRHSGHPASNLPFEVLVHSSFC